MSLQGYLQGTLSRIQVLHLRVEYRENIDLQNPLRFSLEVVVIG